NWVVSAANFPGIPATRRRYPTTSRRIATRDLRRKMARKPKPSRWPAYTSSAHGKGETILRGWVVFSAAPAGARVFLHKFEGQDQSGPYARPMIVTKRAATASAAATE